MCVVQVADLIPPYNTTSCTKRRFSAVAFLVTWRYLLSQCEKLTNYLAHVQLDCACTKEQHKTGGRKSSRAIKARDRLGGGKSGKSTMPEMGHRTILRIEAYFSIIKTKNRALQDILKKNEGQVTLN